jgi:hypothetical protein
MFQRWLLLRLLEDFHKHSAAFVRGGLVNVNCSPKEQFLLDYRRSGLSIFSNLRVATGMLYN